METSRQAGAPTSPCRSRSAAPTTGSPSSRSPRTRATRRDGALAPSPAAPHAPGGLDLQTLRRVVLLGPPSAVAHALAVALDPALERHEGALERAVRRLGDVLDVERWAMGQ